jgi:hypothetical protein
MSILSYWYELNVFKNQVWTITPQCDSKSLMGQTVTKIHTVLKVAHISEKCLGVYMGASPLAGKFPKVV